MLLRLIYVNLLSIIAQLHSTAAQLSCYTAGGLNQNARPTTTIYGARTSTEHAVEDIVSTYTFSGYVPDHTTTLNENLARTEWHTEYLATFTTTHWRILTATGPRPTVTITIPARFAQPQQSLRPGVDVPKRDAQVENPGEPTSTYSTGHPFPTHPPDPYIGGAIPPEKQPHGTQYDTVVCNTLATTTETSTNYRLIVENAATPRRTITMSAKHTSVVHAFERSPAVIETVTHVTTYRTFTTTYQTITSG